MGITICLGLGCKIRLKCGRYGIEPRGTKQSYIATCFNKEAFIGKKTFKKIY